jgi:CyaY protein
MNETEFNQLVDAVLLQIEDALEAGGAELDFETVGGILQIECGNGSKVIINRQTPNRELWVAAKSGGYHFRLQQGRWIDTRDGRELGNAISEIVFSQCAEKILIEIIP